MRQISTLALIASLFCGADSASAAIYTVTSPAPNNTPGTLTWALSEAQISAGPDSIHFSIGSGPVMVEVPFGTIIDHQVIIDGTTQPGYSGTPIVSVSTASIGNSMVFSLLAANSVVRALAFTENTTRGSLGVYNSDCLVDNCWFGVDHDFTVTPGFRGIDVGNVFGSISNITIKDCLIASQNYAIRARDIINLRITDCAIGTDFTAAEVFACADSGIEIIDCTGAYIGPEIGGDGNIIAHCGGDGVGLWNSTDTVIVGNRIFNVGETAIDHGMDDNGFPFNHTNDSDIPGGGTQNIPFVNFVEKTGGSIRIDGELNSTPSTSFLLEFYASTSKGTFARGQGEFRIGVATLSTDVAGDLVFLETFTDTLPDVYPLYFSATATRFDQSWGTSEFSGALLPQNADIYQESDLGNNPGWIPSGIDSGPEHTLVPDSIDDVDVEKIGDELRIIVRPSVGRFRVAGWTNRALATPAPGSLAVIRGKFYVYTSNPADAPLNTVPNFRLRLENEGVVLASNTYEYAATGNTAVPHEPFYGTVNSAAVENRAGESLRPTDSALNPSLYRVDFVPVAVPGNAGSSISATFESYAGPDPANGILALTEVQLAAYTQIVPVQVMFGYANDTDFWDSVNAPDPLLAVDTGSGAFNAEADFQPGRRQALDLVGEVPAGELATVIETPGSNGVLIDTLNTPEDKIGIGIFNIEALNDAEAPRIEPDTSYLAIFAACSSMPAEQTMVDEPVQGSMSFQLQTAGGAITSRLEVLGPASFAGAPGSLPRTIAAQALPGKNSKNLALPDYPFPEGERGGAYLVFLPPVLSQDIRRTTPGDLGPLEDEPGPGVNLPSFRDINIAVNGIEQPTSMRLSPDLVVPWAPPNRSLVRLMGVVLLKLAPIDDGGYLF